MTRVAMPFSIPRLEALVRGSLGTTIESMQEMSGGASTRSYFRLHFSSVHAFEVTDMNANRPANAARTTRANRGPTHAVVMFAPEGAVPEEITSAEDRPRWPFLEMRELLESHGVRVPLLYGEDCSAGLVLLEDLGDTTLAEALRASPSRRPALYTRAVHDLVAMHRALGDCRGSVVATRAFDETLLRWELAHFSEFALDARGVVRSASSRQALDSVFDDVARSLSARPRSFVHRDYQSRNLMLDPLGQTRGDTDALVVIDFQDALLGPRAYDLVALLRDSYQDLSEPFVDEMISCYAREAGLDPRATLSLRDEFDRLTVQRKLKDAGRFVFIDRVKHDPSFLPYVAPSLARVRRALERLTADPVFAKVQRLLREALPDAFGS
ncbi:MAG: hypothetical protein NVSMB1_14890 [Polyangiales bacterium]